MVNENTLSVWIITFFGFTIGLLIGLIIGCFVNDCNTGQDHTNPEYFPVKINESVQWGKMIPLADPSPSKCANDRYIVKDGIFISSDSHLSFKLASRNEKPAIYLVDYCVENLNETMVDCLINYTKLIGPSCGEVVTIYYLDMSNSFHRMGDTIDCNNICIYELISEIPIDGVYNLHDENRQPKYNRTYNKTCWGEKRW